MSIAQSYRETSPPVRVPSGGWSLGALAAAGVLAAACSTHHLNTQLQATPHEIAVQVDNDRYSPDERPIGQPSQAGTAGGPVEMRVFVTRDQGGTRQYLGTVPGGQVQTFKFTPVAYGYWYRLVGITPLGSRVESTRFNIDTPQTGLVEWSLQTGMVNYYDVAPDTTKASPNTTPGGSPPST